MQNNGTELSNGLREPPQGPKEEEVAAEPFMSAYAEYLRALDGVWGATQTRCNEAHGSYLQAWTSGMKKGSAEEADAVSRDYVHQLREIWEESQRGYASAYRAFLESCRNHWASIELARVKARCLQRISAATSGAAWLAERTLGSWDILAAHGVDPRALTLASYA